LQPARTHTDQALEKSHAPGSFHMLRVRIE
jgi:hypothetical protein